jgi:hypothetical protein
MESDIRNQCEDAVSTKSVAVLTSTNQSSHKGRTSLDGDPENSSPTSLDQPLKNLQSDIDAQTGSFNEALALYQTKTAGTKYHIIVDFSPLHTWDEVLQSVNDASKLYNEVPGAWGKIRRALRGFGKSKTAFDAWSALLPSQSEYFSILCGGMKLIYGVGMRTLQIICATDGVTGSCPIEGLEN